MPPTQTYFLFSQEKEPWYEARGEGESRYNRNRIMGGHYSTERNRMERFRHIILRNGAGSYFTTGVQISPCALNCSSRGTCLYVGSNKEKY